MKLTNKVEVASGFAEMIFRDKGQTYGDKPYAHHLKAVHDVLLRFDVTDRDMLAAAWLHDILEDTDIEDATIEDLFGSAVHNLVWAVTDEPGANRKERKEKTYPKIKAVSGAVQLKLADRIANIENSIHTDDYRMFAMYRKEQPAFALALRTLGIFDEMWESIDHSLRVGKMRFEATLLVGSGAK